MTKESSRPSDLTGLDLCVTLTRPWPQCRTVLLEVAPRLLLNNKTDLDLWLVASNKEQQHWFLPANNVAMVTCTDESIQLGFLLTNGMLHSSNVITLSNENDKERHLPRLPDVLYVESSIDVALIVRQDEPKVRSLV